MATNCTGEACERFVPWSFPVCITLMSVVILGSIFGLIKYSDASLWYFPRKRIWSSQWPSVAPLFLMIFRFTAFAYNLGVQIGCFVTFGPGQVVFFTIWNYLLLILFFGLGCLLSILGLRSSRSDARLNPWFLEKMYVVLFQIVFTLSIIVDVVLWGILFPGALKANEEHPGSFDMYLILNFFSYNQHGLNLVWVLAEFLLNDLPFFPVHICYVLLWAASFGLFSWIYNQFTNWWAYPFLETRVPEAPLWYVGLMAVHVIVYLTIYWCYRGKLSEFDEDDNDEVSSLQSDLSESGPDFSGDMSDSLFSESD